MILQIKQQPDSVCFTRLERTMTTASHAYVAIGFAVAVLVCVPVAAAVAQVKENFCVDDGSCRTVKVQNGSGATVLSVKVSQKDSSNNCPKDSRLVKKNLSGTISIGGANYDVKLRDECDYRIKFNTTSGCTGDKAVNYNEDDTQKVVKLSGGCGSLKAAKRDAEE